MVSLGGSMSEIPVGLIDVTCPADGPVIKLGSDVFICTTRKRITFHIARIQLILSFKTIA